jgi:hypothetical protein
MKSMAARMIQKMNGALNPSWWYKAVKVIVQKERIEI